MSRQPIHIDTVPYNSVPQQSGLFSPHTQEVSTASSGGSSDEYLNRGQPEGLEAVASGEVGGSYGPYSYEGQGAIAPDFSPDRRRKSYYRVPSAGPLQTPGTNSVPPSPTRPSRYDQQHSPPSDSSNRGSPPRSAHRTSKVLAVPPWSAKYEAIDEEIHSLNGPVDKVDFTCFSLRGWLNAIVLISILFGLLFMFVGELPVSFLCHAGARESESPPVALHCTNLMIPV